LISDDTDHSLPSIIELRTPSLRHDIKECVIQIFAKSTPIIIGPQERSDPNVTRNVTARRCAAAVPSQWSTGDLITQVEHKEHRAEYYSDAGVLLF